MPIDSGIRGPGMSYGELEGKARNVDARNREAMFYKDNPCRICGHTIDNHKPCHGVADDDILCTISGCTCNGYRPSKRGT